MSNFNVGDRVIVKSAMGLVCHRGIVIDQLDYSVRVSFEDGFSAWCFIRDVRLDVETTLVAEAARACHTEETPDAAV